ncbi:hypothetical protein O6H91_20G067500 [Diphasiastrum complanatum]|uniref:Uncharacterized protein n=1 Tax=Diphasiastrum complanatum TaxID=34168 RepID=A0ACC2ARH8_DIPCM|nr:hypothetical protein O6H91_20G067500 [Diphasiastrum complanatum]
MDGGWSEAAMGAAAEPCGLIKPIDKAAIHRICSGQVILDLATAVKELVENSLDAGASNIEVRLREYGAELIEVADNGCGVSPHNYQGLTLKYHTSKIATFSDLQSLSSFGFRGEALSSLCAVANVSIITRTKEDQVASRLEYDHSGLIVSKESVARAVGTTVIIGKLFSRLPVRCKEFTRNIKREYARLLAVLQGYALIARSVRLICTNQTGRSGRTTIVHTQGSESVKDNIITVFGTKTAACLDPLDVKLLDTIQIEGFVSKPGSGSGRSSGDRQYFYVNGRPVDMPKVSKLLNELYKSFNSQQYPMAVLNFILPTAAYDVNVTPDKRKVFVHEESEIILSLKEALEKIYAPNKYLYEVHRVESDNIPERADQLSIELLDFETQKSSFDFEEDRPQNSESSAETHPSDDFCVEDISSMEMTNTADFTMKENEKSSHTDEGNVDLLSFCCKTSSTVQVGLANQSRAAKKRNYIAEVRPTKTTVAGAAFPGAVQAKLTSFVLQSKEHEKNGAVLTEMPLLKKRALLRKIPEPITDDSTRSAGDDGCEENIGCSRSHDLFCTIGEYELAEREVALKDNTSADGEACPSISEMLEKSQKEEFLESVSNDDDMNFDIQVNKFPIDDCMNENDISSIKTNTSEKNAASKVTLVAQFSLEKLRHRRYKRMVILQSNYCSQIYAKEVEHKRSYTAATLDVGSLRKGIIDPDEALVAATKELERSFDKVDFKRMKVLGQFNLGFILAKLDQDVFILDQHASDEKYNFERLSKSTILNRQPLIRPLQLEISAAEEIVITSHLETFRQNGFDFVEYEDALPGQRLRLSGVPFSKNTTFGAADVQELVSLLSDEYTPSKALASKIYEKPDDQALSHTNQSISTSLIRPSRVRAMLASRACRSSIMIGDALSPKQMEKIISHLADLDAPWNCPHGRPTMRHLVDLTSLVCV